LIQEVENTMKRQISVVTLLLCIATAAYAGLHTRSGTVYVQKQPVRRGCARAQAGHPGRSQGRQSPLHDRRRVQQPRCEGEADDGFHGDRGAGLPALYEGEELDPKKARDCDNNIQSNYARHYKAGQVAFSQSNVTQAAHEFDLATKSDPKQASAHYNLAVSYSRLAQQDSTYYAKTLAESDKVLELAPSTDPNHMHALQLAATTLVSLGKPDDAVARMQKTIDEDPSKYALVEEMGNDLMNDKKWAGASSFLRLAADARAKVSADDAKVLQSIGICEFNLGKTDPAHLDEAVIYYQKSLDVGGDDPNTVFNMMATYIKKADWENAALWGEKYVLLAPSEADGWKLLAQCYGQLGQDDKAAEAMAHYSTLKGQ
jgi:Tfp pilus assembly protein PilF